MLVYGLESHMKTEYAITPAMTLPLSVTYTFTQTEFENSFVDQSGVFKTKGDTVEVGDELAYVPQHRLNIKAGLQAEQWQLMLSALYQGEMRNAAGAVPKRGSHSSAP